jgi:hypothetical protein
LASHPRGRQRGLDPGVAGTYYNNIVALWINKHWRRILATVGSKPVYCPENGQRSEVHLPYQNQKALSNSGKSVAGTAKHFPIPESRLQKPQNIFRFRKAHCRNRKTFSDSGKPIAGTAKHFPIPESPLQEPQNIFRFRKVHCRNRKTFSGSGKSIAGTVKHFPVPESSLQSLQKTGFDPPQFT